MRDVSWPSWSASSEMRPTLAAAISWTENFPSWSVSMARMTGRGGGVRWASGPWAKTGNREQQYRDRDRRWIGFIRGLRCCMRLRTEVVLYLYRTYLVLYQAIGRRKSLKCG